MSQLDPDVDHLLRRAGFGASLADVETFRDMSPAAAVAHLVEYEGRPDDVDDRIGRPDHVHLIFDRRVTRQTPGRLRTRVLTDGVVPSLHVDYKHSRIKQYHKEGRALRTETTINDTRTLRSGVG